MEPGFAQHLLTLWEQGYHRSVVWRGLTLLTVAYPDTSVDTLARLPIGERDGYLLMLYQQLFGSQIEAVSKCPGCDEMVEVSCRVSDITVFDPNNVAREGVVIVSGKKISFRLPNSLDLMAVAEVADAERARQLLLFSCLTKLNKRQQTAWKKRIPKQVEKIVTRKMAALDLQGNIEMALTCPACGHQWLILFDIVSFLWDKVDRWAIRTVQEIHALALAYGWSQQTILDLSPWRRQLYLQMVTG